MKMKGKRKGNGKKRKGKTRKRRTENILTFKFLDIRREDKGFWTEW
jgi:hypothetical protein